MPRNSLKHGVAGQSHAAHSAYRLNGGSHDHPLFFQPEMKMARTVQPSDFRETAMYANGVLGGILGKLVLGIPLSPDEQSIVDGANAKPPEAAAA